MDVAAVARLEIGYRHRAHVPNSRMHTPVAFISNSDCGRHDTGWQHPEHVGRLRAIPRALRNDITLYESLQHHEGRHATAVEIALAHDTAYIEQVRTLVAAGGGRLDADT